MLIFLEVILLVEDKIGDRFSDGRQLEWRIT